MGLGFPSTLTQWETCSTRDDSSALILSLRGDSLAALLRWYQGQLQAL